MKRQFDEYIFEHICGIEADRNKTGEIQVFIPEAVPGHNYPAKGLHNYGQGPFCHFSIGEPEPKLDKQGVYILTVNNEPFYVGKCERLFARFNSGYGHISPRNRYKGGQPTNCRVNNLIYEALKKGDCIDLWSSDRTLNR